MDLTSDGVDNKKVNSTISFHPLIQASNAVGKKKKKNINKNKAVK